MKRTSIQRISVFTGILVCFFGLPGLTWESPSHAPPKTFEDMCKRSRNIIVAEFERYGFEEGLKPSEFIWANYKVILKLKNPESISGEITTEYAFNDIPNNVKPESWKFSKVMMPKKKSKWILFLENFCPSTNTYYTYRGTYGRMPYDEKTIDKVKNIVK